MSKKTSSKNEWTNLFFYPEQKIRSFIFWENLVCGSTILFRDLLTFSNGIEEFFWWGFSENLNFTIGLVWLKFMVAPKAICNYLMSRIAIRIHKLPAFRATHSSAFISHAHILPIQHIKVFACENTRVIQNSKKFKKFHFWGIFWFKGWKKFQKKNLVALKKFNMV